MVQYTVYYVYYRVEVGEFEGLFPRRFLEKLYFKSTTARDDLVFDYS